MIATVVKVGLLRMRNNPLELVVVFVVPVIFFSIFAMIFGHGIGPGKAQAVRVVVVDEDESDLSEQAVKRFLEHESFRGPKGDTGSGEAESDRPLKVRQDRALELLQQGRVTIAIVMHEGYQEGPIGGQESPVTLLADTADPIASKVVEAVVSQTTGELLGKEKARQAKMRQRMRAMLLPGSDPSHREESSASDAGDSEEQPPPMAVVEDVLAKGKNNPSISMFAAGIAVLFILFSATGAGATLLEEQESGTLDRLLSSQLTVGGLLIGKWLYITLLSSVQLLTMFVWGQLVFGIDLVGHFGGFLVMALSTAAAASSLGLCLATVCKSRTQLNGVSLILILSMSALGGSMIPRYVMSPRMQEIGLVTFNAWALDGFHKVFWLEQPVSALTPQVSVLLMTAVVLGGAARLFAGRWA